MYLQKAIYYLPPHIFLVRSKEFALEHAEYAFRDAEIGLEVFGYSRSTLVMGDLEMRTSIIRGNIKEGSKGVVDYFVLMTARRDYIVEFCVAC
jgi:hypothetical protein